MSNVISILRVLTLLFIFGIAFLSVMAVPDYDQPFGTFALSILASKILAFVGFYASFKLYATWRKTDKWIKAYENILALDKD